MSDSPRPMAVSDCTPGPAHVLKWNGREYPVTPPTPEGLARIEKLIVRRAKDALDEMRDVYTPAEFAAEQEALRAAVRAREFAPGGTLWAAEMKADGGGRALQFILWACLPAGLSFDDAGDLFAEEPDEAHLAVACVLPDFTSRVAEAQRLPQATRTERRAKAEVEAEKLKRAARPG